MATTTFYTHLNDLTGFACRLTQKVYKSGQNVLVWLMDEEHLHQFDQTLWSFEASSFVPHEICLSDQPLPSISHKVLLACGTKLPSINADIVVINLADIYWCNAPIAKPAIPSNTMICVNRAIAWVIKTDSATGVCLFSLLSQ